MKNQFQLCPKPEVREKENKTAVGEQESLLGSLTFSNRSTFSMEKFAELFVKYGLVIVNDVEATSQATETLCRRVAPIHDTFFGAFWVFSNKTHENGEEYHEDTAYGNEGIGPHTDGTYFNQTPGIQVFHCLHPAVEGGDTVLVDGFNCARQLKEENPNAFEILSRRKIEHHYVEVGDTDGGLFSTSREKSVIELDLHGNLVQIRMHLIGREWRRVLFHKPFIL
ncbi:taurine catabolism dioxygenase, TauD/TfdA family [Ancylostoma ceylanicum]|uniref:Taurine catabolism dioxygenase, TauD/TfdA family n=1 Tax=Ancylostoma ceylanicum TaxID=53326 RepID=A0A0D6M2X4_9BILA|nr:taurine catabolism dioxygenase, TauD/TfdA family [Ancylostoma ceylanicum]